MLGVVLVGWVLDGRVKGQVSPVRSPRYKSALSEWHLALKHKSQGVKISSLICSLKMKAVNKDIFTCIHSV